MDCKGMHIESASAECAFNPVPIASTLVTVACDRVRGFNLIACDILSCDCHLLAAPRCHTQCNNGISWAGHGSMCMFWSQFFFSGTLF